ncbi:hypothetical protein [Calothrix sp. NIES-2098]|uniref:hypothetical protein n=1 Tax=Calothrix sp. NIES-2098 TaxID=1954171 RepID=UPI000B618C6C|nr:aliphatic sulfonates ABC transporter substrate-binding protein [Calothrix sp. NIES-2098]
MFIASLNAIADFLCRLQKSQNWRESNLQKWSKIYATAINLDEEIVYKDVQEGQQQHPQKLFPVSEEAISSKQKVADSFFKAGVIPTKVDDKHWKKASFGIDTLTCGNLRLRLVRNDCKCFLALHNCGIILEFASYHVRSNGRHCDRRVDAER